MPYPIRHCIAALVAGLAGIAEVSPAAISGAEGVSAAPPVLPTGKPRETDPRREPGGPPDHGDSRRDIPEAGMGDFAETHENPPAQGIGSAGPDNPSGLLSMWSPEELRGQPGDERITLLRSPDFMPRHQPVLGPNPAALNPLPLDSIRRVSLPPGKKWVALTFDLCEQADEITGYDGRIVDTLRGKAAKATFYAGGKWMQSHPERTMQLMADPLFEIGNHGWTHGNLRVLKGERMREQIVWTQAEYRRVRDGLAEKAAARGLQDLMGRVPAQPATLRFPYGTCSRESLRAVNELGLGAVQWDVVSGDPGGIAAPEAIIRAIRPGSIVVFHANGRGKGTAAALPKIIDGLRAKGFEFVKVGEMLSHGEADTVPECYELKPGDNLRYDALFGEGLVASGKRGPNPRLAAPVVRRATIRETP